MGKLIKYEILKSKTMIIVFSAISLLVEAAFLLGNYLTNNVETGIDYIDNLFQIVYVLGIVAYFCMLPVAAIIILVFAVTALTSDIGKRQGYTVFLTPNSARSILGAKLIVSSIASVLIIIYFLLISSLNFSILDDQMSGENSLISGIFALIREGIDEGYGVTLFIGFLSLAAQWFANITLIYFAVALTYTMLSNTRGKSIIAFLLYIVISSVVSSISSIPMLPLMRADISEIAMMNIVLSIALVLNTAMAVGFFYATAATIDKKLSM